MKSEMEYTKEYVDSVHDDSNTFDELADMIETATGAYSTIINLQGILESYDIYLPNVERYQEELLDQVNEVWNMTDEQIVELCLEILEKDTKELG